MKYVLLSLSVFLVSCATQPCTPVCLPLTVWDDMAQNNAKADLESLPDDSPLVAMMIDYGQLRARIRSCNGAGNI